MSFSELFYTALALIGFGLIVGWQLSIIFGGLGL